MTRIIATLVALNQCGASRLVRHFKKKKKDQFTNQRRTKKKENSKWGGSLFL